MEYKNIFDELLSQVDIVTVINNHLSLIKKGKNYIAICPFHEDSKPSLTVSVEKQVFKCFACNVGGNAISFVEKFLKISFLEASKMIAQENGINLEFSEKKQQRVILTKTQEQIIEANNLALSFYKYNIFDKQNKSLVSFLNSRNINDANLIDFFELGFASNENLKEKIMKKDSTINEAILSVASLINSKNGNFFENRMIFPIKDENDFLVGFSGREIVPNSNNVKYLNTSENAIFNKGNVLYNFNKAKEFITYKKELIICEGFMDVIALYKIGIKNVTALMGTSFSNNHIKLFNNIKDIKIVFFLDGDLAGKNATIKSINKIIKYKFEIEIINNPLKMDPDEILNRLGQSRLEEIVKSRKNVFEFLLDYFLEINSLNNSEKIIDFCKIYSQYLQHAKQDIKIIILDKIKKTEKIPQELIDKYFAFKTNNLENQDYNVLDFDQNYKNTYQKENKYKANYQNNFWNINDFKFWQLNQSEKVILSLFDSYRKDPKKELIVLFSIKKNDFVLKNLALNEIAEKLVTSLDKKEVIKASELFDSKEKEFIDNLLKQKYLINYPKFNESKNFEILLESLKNYESSSLLINEIGIKLKNNENIDDSTLEIMKKEFLKNKKAY
ncbi:DNA primase [[Mycoplasma] mobile]|uniref:DNA primase n=1 Tax=Mycoplasma mobile (strain ATCC 43663 / 163K / NCTC 11711) TaxID=267748 RepID=Q6KHZ9_MYCM1|nr:DNA primase [[Mycoplasma] mobile]AAT27777.1 DNA primase [Mycoplasma mobile 163K]